MRPSRQQIRTRSDEMRVGFDLQIGKNINLKGSGRLTPAGL
jgi:hypothetical protein